MFTYKIIATTDAHDWTISINPGDVIEAGDADELFETETQAIAHGTAILNGLDGSGAFNMVRDEADVIAIKV